MSTSKSNNDFIDAFIESIQTEGQSLDELPGSYGEFGLVATNPVPTFSVIGSGQYLEQLRTLDGQPIKFKRVGSRVAENFPDTPVDKYRIESASGEELSDVYLCMYHKQNSTKAPTGFYLEP